VKNGGVFCKKKWKMGVFYCEKVDLSSTQGALCTVSVFILHFTYLGGAYAPPLPTGLANRSENAYTGQAHMHAQADGHVENIMPPSAHHRIGILRFWPRNIHTAVVFAEVLSR